jgi:TetR/AcrR family transcriptional repressor of nem operon
MGAKELVVEQRRLTPKGRATRDRIVSVAAQLMSERGVAGTSLGDVQKTAGVGASQVYHYFADKQSLIRAVIAHNAEAVLGAMRPQLGRLDSMEALRAWRDVLVATMRQRDCEVGCPLGSLVAEVAERFPDCRGDLVKGFDQWEAAVRGGLEAMYEQGDLRRKADPGRLAVALLAAVQGGTLLAQLHRDPAPLETALDEVLDRIEDLRPRQPRLSRQ